MISIDEDAFNGCRTDLIIKGNLSSEAERFAKSKGYKFVSVGYSKPAVSIKVHTILK